MSKTLEYLRNEEVRYMNLIRMYKKDIVDYEEKLKGIRALIEEQQVIRIENEPTTTSSILTKEADRDDDKLTSYTDFKFDSSPTLGTPE